MDVAADLGFEEAFAWLFRVVGLLLVFAGVGVWLFAGVTLLVPAVLVVVGLVSLLAPGVVLSLVELAG